MIMLKGRYNAAKIFTDTVEDKAREQIARLCSQKAYEDSQIRIMPDVHAGAGCTIGTTMTITDKVTPNLVGVDIGCGMLTAELMEKDIDFHALDQFIHKNIPAGFHKRDTPHPFAQTFPFHELRCKPYVNRETAMHSLGTLGGGNHFIEIDRDAAGNLYLVIHSGSRHLGVEIAKYYQTVAQEMTRDNKRQKVLETISELKSQGRETEIESAVQALAQEPIPNELAFLSDDMLEDYLFDMALAQEYATENRVAICSDILMGLKLHSKRRFTTIHNYIDIPNRILRKGAVSAQRGEMLLIPINMRDGSLLCKGKGNPDWNYSAPHGAGRFMSRTEAKRNCSMEEYQEQMQGVYTTSVNEGTLDECPMAYKGMDEIIENIFPTAEIVTLLRPVYNFKAGEQKEA